MDLDDLGRRAEAAGWDLPPDEQRRLLEYVIALGASEEELVPAIEAMNIGGLALDLAMRTGTPAPFADVAEAAGMRPEDAARYWRALGFPDPLRNGTRLDDSDTGALAVLLAGRDLLGEEGSLALSRVVGMATSRIAQAVLDVFRVQYEAPHLASGSSYAQLVENYTKVARVMLPQLVEAAGAVMIRHLILVSASAWSADAEGAAAQQDLAVGFADMTGYTALSRSLTPRDLSRVISAFEEAVSEAASNHGGRVVKLVGDGAMFSADDAERACRIAADIIGSSIRSELVPSVRVGVAAGRVVNLGGDLFGPVVNLAARLAAVSPDNAVVVDAEAAGRARASLSFDEMPPQELKGVGAPSAAFVLVLPRD